MKTSSLILTMVALGAVTATADAQGRGKSKGNQGVPPGHRPPAGMCRIWINNVPPGHQPAPTDCETAVRNQPANSQIIWGDNTTPRGRNVNDNDRRDDRDRNDRPAPDDNTGGATPVDRGQYPSQMPAMTGAVLVRVGVRSADVQNWLGRTDVRSETVDSNGDGVPEQASWYDANGTLLQVWRDEDRDGRADSVEIYRNGQRVQVVR
jgi:hypothetical protein